MAVLNTGLATPSTGFTIDQSLRFNDDDSAYLSRTPSTASDLKKMTWSCWVKIGDIDGYRMLTAANAGGGGQDEQIRIETGGELQFASGTNFHLRTTQLLRDHSAWYHIVIAFDSTESETDRIKFWINGSRVTSFGTETYPSADETLESINQSSVTNYIGWQGSSLYWDGYMAELHMIDGTAYDADDFGESGDYGEWKPKEVSGLTYGNNGFYLDFADAADLGDDESGEGNDWTENNIDAADQMLDTPTNNFPTIVPMLNTSLSEGNLKVATSRTGNWDATVGSMGAGSGKWYYEAIYEHGGENFRSIAGWVAEVGRQTVAYNGLGGSGDPNSSLRNNYEYAPWLGSWYNNSSSGGTAPTITGDGTDIIGFAIDIDNDEMWVAINNVWYANDGGTDGDPAGGTNQSMTLTSTYLPSSPLYVPSFRIRSDSTAGLQKITANFGQDSSFAGEKTAQGNADGNGYGDFYYTPPSGFLALCTANLDTPAVIPSEHFNTVLYDGDGTTSNAITGVGFQPDFVWLKTMSAASTHRLYDTVRGVAEGSSTHLTGADITEDTFVSFDADGFTVKEHAVDGNHTNDDGDNFVAWNWKAASTASGTTTGSGTGKAYSAVYNTDAGFSMVTYLGNDTAGHTIPHHLSKAPEWFMIKAREHTDPWCLFHHNLHPSTPELYADEMNAVASFGLAPTYWNDTAPTSSVFTVGSSNNVNLDDEGYMAYCFHSVEGYSKVGTYEGNDDADGTFVYTGFRPAYVWIKNIDASSNWVCHDTTRNTYNPSTKRMVLNLAAIERTDLYGILDFTSNGFKLRDGDNLTNEETYIYYAVAETPFKYANAR